MTYQYVQPFPRLLLFGQFVLLLDAIVRGLNYFATPEGANVTLLAIERSSVGGVWGALFIGFGSVGILAEAGMLVADTNRGWQASFFAHAALAGLFVTSAVSAWWGVAQRDPFYGFATAFDLGLVCIGHLVFVRARRNE